MWIRFALFNAALAAILTAQPKPAIWALSVSPAKVTLTVGGSQQLVVRSHAVESARVRIDYLSADTTVALVDSTGHVTGRRAGTATLTVRARAEAEHFVSSELTAQVPVVIQER